MSSTGAGQTRTVTVPVGAYFSPTTVATGGVEFDPIGGGSTTVSATAPGFRTATPVNVTVSAPAMTLFSLPALVGAGLQSGGYTARLGATAHGGVTVRITSSNPAVLLVSPNATTVGTASVDIPVANGSTDATYYIHGIEGARGTVTLTATASGFTQAQRQRHRRGARVAAGRRAGEYDDVVDQHGVLRVSRGLERFGPVCRLSAGAPRGGERHDHGEQQQCRWRSW